LGESERAGPVPDAGHQSESIDLNHSSRHPPIVETAPSPADGAVDVPLRDPLTLDWPDEAATAAFAARLAAQPATGRAFITLHGDLGAGKTTLVRHLLRALGVQGRIKSPTYAVVEPHVVATRTPPLPVWHFDFYRFDDPREWEDAGFRDVFAADGLKLAEWPEKAGAMLPAADLAITIAARADEGRDVQIAAHTPLGYTLLEALA
jgi:tRNA threonylcarbamoyladenosine biosynthesis protein TsaE